jgi:hypothetical protein
VVASGAKKDLGRERSSRTHALLVEILHQVGAADPFPASSGTALDGRGHRPLRAYVPRHGLYIKSRVPGYW